MKRIVNFGLIFVLMGLMGLPSTQAQENPNPANLPLLAEGTHYGITQPGGEITDEPRILTRVTEATNAGIEGFTFYIEWATLEPERGVYDFADLEATLNWLDSEHIQPMLNLTLIDIDLLTLPPNLLNAEGTALADGLTFDDPTIQTRLSALLDQIVPLFVQSGGFLLCLGNEVDEWFKESPEASPEILEDYAALVAATRDYIHTLVPELAVGVTLTGDETLEQGEVFQAITPVADVTPFNFYPLSELLTVLPLEEIPPTLEAYLEVHGDKPIVIQELGCPSDASMESSPGYQAQCFGAMFQTLQNYPQIRFISVFTLADWDKTTCDLIVDFFSTPEDEELPPIYKARWRGFLCTLGLLNPDYSPKPSWEVLLGINQAGIS